MINVFTILAIFFAFWAILLFILKIFREIKKIKPKIKPKKLSGSESGIDLWPALTGEVADNITNRLHWAKLSLSQRQLKKYGLCLLAALILAILIKFWFLVFLIVSGLASGVGYIYNRAKKNKAKFINQLPDGLLNLSEAIKAGFSLNQAMTFVAKEIGRPLQNVFLAFSRAEQIGLGFSAALSSITNQLQLTEWAMVAETLAAGQETGGSMAGLLKDAAETLRERRRLEQEIKSLTAAGRMSGYLIAGLAPVVLLFFFAVSPGYVSILFNSLLGRLILVLAGALEVIGFLWIHKIVGLDY